MSLNRYRYDEEETGRVKEEEMTSSFGIHSVSCGSGQLGMRSRVSFLADLLASLTAFPDMKQESAAVQPLVGVALAV